MITLATIDMFPALEAMWRNCFGDDMRYTGFVFESLLKPQNILVEVGGDGQPRAMVCVEYMDIAAADGSAIPGAYVYAVATLPEHRGKGLSTALMNDLHLYLADKGVCCSVLVPAEKSLFDFYAKRGYEVFSRIKKAVISADEVTTTSLPCVLTPSNLSRMYQLRERIFGDGLYVRWDRRYLDYICQECRFLGGGAVLCSGGGVEGYAVCYRDNDSFVIKELAVQPEYEADFIAALHKRLGGLRYTIYFPEDRKTNFPSQTLPFSMVRMYDGKKGAMIAIKGQAPYLTHAMD